MGDIMKEKMEQIIDKVKNDKDFMNKFKTNPITAVEEVLGINLPDDQINKIIDGVKAKLALDDGKSAVDKIKGIFNK